ncbi:epoxide hydrolase [Rhodococcus gordoniae]|uniref:Epoxide hydrolase n=1 Tax=Rhodococcus gordoniae TaxID=223392 RepID=A0A379M240_9NOCA|nr:MULTISPECIES: alpha/beta fold hydrolase [Rhodococcus]UTT48974.1 alpha/beta fold hydrolase [Rhodococcus gordoniae]SUE16367.1 epoxide hydrolase [Rhodococcus gordoniae]
MEERITTVERDGLRFDIRDDGPLDGEPIVLLHGFPQDSRSWDAVAPHLHAAGYRTFAPDQRGYSPGARPPRRRDYLLELLVDDVVALVEAVPGGRAHVVGHDWGAAVAWVLAAHRPELVRTVTAVSVPHPAAFLRSFVTGPQLLRSWYMLVFQLPWIPEILLGKETVARRMLSGTGQPSAATDRDVARLKDRAAVRAGVNWYRAVPLSNPKWSFAKVTVPTLMVWSDKDSAIGPGGVEATARYVTGPYRRETLVGTSHWIPDEEPEKLARLVLEHVAAHG